MKATLSKRRHPASVHRRPKHRPVRRAHKAHRAVPAAAAAVPPPAAQEEEPTVVIDTVYAEFGPDKRDEELSDEEALDREERQDLY